MIPNDSVLERWQKEATTSIPRQLNSVEVEYIKNLPYEMPYWTRVVTKMITDTREIIVTYADKVKALEFAGDFVPQRYLPEQYLITETASDLRGLVLPREFVIKASHGSGGMIAVSEDANPADRVPDPGPDSDWARLSIHPDTFDLERAITLFDRWLTLKYRQADNTIREWCYTEIPPRIRVEKLYKGKYLIPTQVNIYYFKGVLGSIIYFERDADDNYPINLRFLSSETDYARISAGISQSVWTEIIESGKQMSQFTDMVRIDWMITDEGPIFSELTNYPSGGYIRFMGTSSRTGDDEHEEYCRMWDGL